MTPTQPASPQINDPRPQYFDDPNLDRLMAVVVSLTNELWVVKDRLMVLESRLAAHGGVTSDEIDHYQPTADERRRLEDARKAYIARVLSGLAIDPLPPEQIRSMKGIKPIGG